MEGNQKSNLQADGELMLSLEQLTFGSLSSAPAAEHYMERAASTDLACIGAGYCAQIFAGADTVLKRAYPSMRDDLWHDYRTHLRVSSEFLIYSTQVHVPRLFDFYREYNDRFWLSGPGARFPDRARVGERRWCLEAERIMPVPAEMVKRITQLFCPPQLQEAAWASPDKGACLMRVYLGARSTTTSTSEFGLLNVPLSLDKMEKLEMNPYVYARQIGQGLAIVHWAAESDGRDIEWVLAGSPSGIRRDMKLSDVRSAQEPLDTQIFMEAVTRPIELWLLDFNQCRDITLDEHGCNQAVESFFANDPYYPKPKLEPELWESFAAGYLTMASTILDPAKVKPAITWLPHMFISKIVDDRRSAEAAAIAPPPRAQSVQVDKWPNLTPAVTRTDADMLRGRPRRGNNRARARPARLVDMAAFMSVD